MPFFSVVTSAYNAEDYLERAINSVLRQSFQDIEFLIVDNGSNDGTRAIINKAIETKPTIVKGIFVDKNKGISGGRNLGIQNAIGKYICFLDADDYWQLDKLQIVKNIIESNPSFTMFCHWEYHIHNSNKYIAHYRQPNNDCLYEDLLVNGNCLSTSAMVINRELLSKNNGFDESLVSGEEDYDLWLRLANDSGKVLMIDQPLGNWIIRDDSISAKHVVHTEAVVRIVEHYFLVLMAQNYSSNNLNGKMRKAIARLYCGCARILSKNGDRKESKKMFLKSLKNDRLYFKSYAGLLMNFLHV